MNLHTRKPLARRTFLRGAGVAMALPMLDAMLPRALAASAAEAASPRRMVNICTNMGMMPEFFFPQSAGRDYETTEYLKILENFRDDMTVFSGVSHPDVDGGHQSETSFLTAAPHPASSGFHNTISLDQYAAERLGFRTRFPSLVLKVGSGRAKLSWTADGVSIPPYTKPSEVYKRLFVRGSAEEVDEQVHRLRTGRSILDAVAGRAKNLERRVGARDRRKLDQYFTSVRELERRLVQAEEWKHKPKPTVNVPPPVDIKDRAELIDRTRLMFNMARLALDTDSTRVISFHIDQNANPTPNLEGVSSGHHSLTHHGKREDSIEQLKIIETAQTEAFRDFLADLKDVREESGTLLDNTMVLYGSNLGNANTHDNRNMPVLLAGGGFRHGQHIAFDKKRNYPLCNLYVSMLQRLGVEADRFASGTGTMRGLEMTR